MIETEEISTQADAENGAADQSTIWLIGDDANARQTLREACRTLDGVDEIIDIEGHGGLMAETARPDCVTACCLLAGARPDATKQTVQLARQLLGDTPIVVVDADKAGLDLAGARNTGAWDIATLNEPESLAEQIGRAHEFGRQRRDLARIGHRLNGAERRIDDLVEMSHAPWLIVENRRISEANRAFAALVDVGDITQLKGQDLLGWVSVDDRDSLGQALDQTLENGVQSSLALTLEPSDAPSRPVQARLEPARGENGREPAVTLTLQSLDAPRHALMQRAFDPLVDGRMALHNELAQSTRRDLPAQGTRGLVFVAVDDIDDLQKEFGLAQSDILLQDAGLFLLDALQGSDRCFRFAAGEYALLIERSAPEEIGETAERIRNALQSESFGDTLVSTSLCATIGHIVLGHQSTENDRRLLQVVNATYEQRNRGGNQCVDCSAGLAETAVQNDGSGWPEALRGALTHDRFRLAYQGVTSLAGDEQSLFDVLLRYLDDQGELIRAGEFLSAATQSGLMPEIDRWVARHAIDVIAQHQAQAETISLFIKLSPATIEEGGEFLRWLQDTVDAAGIPRKNLIFSFREADVRTQTRAAKTLAVELDAQGFRIALTHFGNNEKAIQVLESIPASFIKLAPSFAKEVAEGEEGEFLKRIISSARSHKLLLIAEQIEDASSMARLWQAGVNYVQGHFIQEPDTEALSQRSER